MGHIVEDDIALTKDGRFQAHDVNFISVFRAVGLSNLKSDGILGLSPRHNDKDYNSKT